MCILKMPDYLIGFMKWHPQENVNFFKPWYPGSSIRDNGSQKIITDVWGCDTLCRHAFLSFITKQVVALTMQKSLNYIINFT